MMKKKARWLLPLLWVVVIFGTVGVTQAMGLWQTSGRQPVVADQMTTTDIKGWMTVQQVADGLGVEPAVVLEAIGDTSGTVTASTALKDIEPAVPGFSVADLRTALDQRLSGASASPSGEPS
jgi:hypothetical protein